MTVNRKNLSKIEIYEVEITVKVCYYDNDTGCAMQDSIKLQPRETLSYISLTKDNDGLVFQAENGNFYVLHDNDLANLKLLQ